MVADLRQKMLGIELDDWREYFDRNPAEWEQSERLEWTLARIASGFFKGVEPEDIVLLSDEQRQDIANRKLIETASGNQ